MSYGKRSLILIVDDSLENLQILGEMLGESGYVVAVASDGYEALNFVKEEKPDLILMDIMMPGMNGIEVCAKIKKGIETTNIPVIFISALTQTLDKLNAFEVGGADYITKPFNRDEVLARVKTHVSMKKLLEENIQQKNELEKMNSSKDKFFSIISHDLRSQIGGISGVAKLLSAKLKLNGLTEIEPFAERLVQSSTKLHSLLENLLSWASIQRKGMKYQPQVINIKEQVEECIQTLMERAQLKQIKILNETEDANVYVDENMILTVIRNLLSNSIKFTHAGGEIRVASKKISEDLFEIRVIDNGIGMDTETQSKLFKISEKSSRPGTEKEEGSGLGLMLCKDLIEINNGNMFIKSEVGKGTAIRVTIPIKDKEPR